MGTAIIVGAGLLYVFLPAGQTRDWMGIGVTYSGGVLGVLGAGLGLKMVFGKLSMGCPVCHRPGQVIGGNRDGLFFDCPSCGELRCKMMNPFRLTVIRPGEAEDYLADYVPPGPSHLLDVSKRHPMASLCVFLLAISSLAAASAIHRFEWFYLGVPLVFCLGVGLFLIDAMASGYLSDNHGTASRARNPVRFWIKFAIWSFAFAMGLCLPVLYALQEKGERDVPLPLEKVIPNLKG